MYMDAFKVASARSTNGCVLLLFKEWELDTKAKMVIACIGVFFLGMFTDVVIQTRRRLGDLVPDGIVGNLLLGLAYGVQLTLGYFVMLIVMIYSVELFLCVIFGFVCSHTLFYARNKAAVDAGATPCCAIDPADKNAQNVQTVDSPITVAPGQQLITLKVTGMTCASCAALIKRGLRPLKAEVDWRDGIVKVSGGEDMDPQTVRETIEKVGTGTQYEAIVLPS